MAEQHYQADVVIVGGGIAGIVTAYVVFIEKSVFVGTLAGSDRAISLTPQSPESSPPKYRPTLERVGSFEFT